MKIEILTGNEPYLIDKHIQTVTEGYEILRSNTFSFEEISYLRQISLFGRYAVVVTGALNKESEELLESFIKGNHDFDSMLLYVPGYEDKRKKLFKLDIVNNVKKPTANMLKEFLADRMEENNVPYNFETLNFLIEYSEYLDDDKVSLYDLLGVIKATTGTAITKQHIERTFARSAKEDAFKLISLLRQKDELIMYMNRLSTSPYAIIGALIYSFRIMAKLKLSKDIGIGSYQMAQYEKHVDLWGLEQLVEKIKLLNALKENHEPAMVMKGMILATLIE